METWPYPKEYMESLYLVRTKHKEEKAKEIIRKIIRNNKVLTTLSGKDSVVALHLALSVGVAIDVTVISAYIANKHLPQAVIDELQAIAQSLGVRVIIHNAPWDIHDSLFRIICHTYNCDILITGLRRKENRRHSSVVEYYDRYILLNPIINWSVNEVWSYIFHYRLPVPSLYRFATRPETPLQFFL